MAQTQGYPTEANIATYLTAQGVEEITENQTDYMQEYRQGLWQGMKRTEAVSALSCYAPTTTTVNFIAGNYTWNGEEKTYSPTSNNNPTDNDTTYYWMDSANTVQSAIDGTGWPATEHMKIAEVAVNASGVITDITDRRTAVHKLFSSGVTSGVTTGLIMVKSANSATVKALLDTATNNLFAVNANDFILKIVFCTGTAAGATCVVDIGLDAAAGSGADLDGFIIDANANAAGVASSEDNTYAGVYADQGGKLVAANGYVTIDSSTDQDSSSWVGAVYMFYIPYKA